MNNARAKPAKLLFFIAQYAAKEADLRITKKLTFARNLFKIRMKLPVPNRSSPLRYSFNHFKFDSSGQEIHNINTSYTLKIDYVKIIMLPVGILR